MKLYSPITSIIKKHRESGITEYILHAVTLIDSNIFISDGSVINRDGSNLNIDLLIKWDKSIEHIGVISPVVHNVFLGELPKKNTKINVAVKYNDRLVGKNTTDDDHAEEDEKPDPPFINEY